MNFTSSTTSSFVPLIVLDIFTVVFGLPMHSYVIWLIVTGSGVTSEFFILNLSVCEI
ncbi:hypothetical protein M9458_042594, partial [Cirrhinus mrigala]